MFGLNRGQGYRRDDDDPIKAQASWQLEHGADRHDLTPDQDRRNRDYAAMTNAGLDVAHVGFARWLVEHRRVQP